MGVKNRVDDLFVCESCGYVFKGRMENPKDRQCSRCRSHRVFDEGGAEERVLELRRRINNLQKLCEA